MRTYTTEAEGLYKKQFFLTTELCQVVYLDGSPGKVHCKNLWTGQYFNLHYLDQINAFSYKIWYRRKWRQYLPKQMILTFRYRRRAYRQKYHHEAFFIKHASFLTNVPLEELPDA